jgi:hypothetical protein
METNLVENRWLSSVTVVSRPIARYGLMLARGVSCHKLSSMAFTPYTSPFLNDRDVFSFVALNGIRE